MDLLSLMYSSVVVVVVFVFSVVYHYHLYHTFSINLSLSLSSLVSQSIILYLLLSLFLSLSQASSPFPKVHSTELKTLKYINLDCSCSQSIYRWIQCIVSTSFFVAFVLRATNIINGTIWLCSVSADVLSHSTSGQHVSSDNILNIYYLSNMYG